MVDREHLDRIVAGSGCPAWIVDPGGMIASANAAAAELLQWPVGALAAAPVANFLATDFAAPLDGISQGIGNRTIRSRCCQAILVDAEKAERFVEIDLAPVEQEAQVVAVLWRVRSLLFERPSPAGLDTQRAPSAEEGADPVQHFEILQSVSDHAGVGKWYFDLGRYDMWATDTYYRMLGFAPGEVALDSAWVRSRIHPDDLEQSVQAIYRLLHDDSDSFATDYRLRRKDGSYRWFHVTARKFNRDSRGLPPVVCGCLIDIDQRKKTATAVARARDLLNNLAENAPGAIFECRMHPGGAIRYTYFSDRLPEITGVPRELIEADGAAILDAIPGDDLPVVQAAIKEAVRTGTPAEFRHRIIHPERGERWLLVFTKPVERADGSIDWYGNSLDITEQVTAEQRASEAADHARRLEERLTLATGTAGIGVWDLDLAAGRNAWDATMHALYGLTPGSFEGTYEGWRQRVHPDDIAAAETNFLGAVESGGVFDDAFRIIRPDGAVRMLKARARVYLDPAGKPARAIGVNFDVTEQIAAERRVAEAAAHAQMMEERLRLATGAAGIGVWDYDIADGTLEWDDTMFALYGMEPRSLDGHEREWRRLVHPDDLAGADAIFAEALKSCGHFGYEFRIRRQDGEERVLKALARVFVDDDGQPERVVGVNQDITDEKAAAQQLAAAAAEVRRAHDRLNLLADNAPGALFEYLEHADGQIEFPYFSANMPGIMGLSRAALTSDGAAIFTNIHPDDVPRIVEDIATSKKERSLFTAHFRIAHPERGERWILATSRPFPQMDGSTLWYGNLFDVTEKEEMERRAAEAAEEIRVAHDRLNALAGGAPGALIEFRVAPGEPVAVPYFSANLPEMVGVAPEDLEADGMALGTHVPQDDQDMIIAALDQATSTLETATFRHRLNHPQKGMRWILSTSTPRKETDGSVHFSGILVDVTEQVNAERQAAEAAEALRIANDRFLNIADNAPCAIFESRLSPDGKIEFTFLSSVLLDLMGVERADVEADSDNLFAHIPPDDAKTTHDEIMRCAAALERFEVRHRVEHPEKGLRWVIATAKPRRGEDGWVTWFGSALDITERVEIENRAAQAAEDLQRAHERLNRIADISTVGLFEACGDSAGATQLTYSSARFNELVGYSADEIAALDDPVFERVLPEDLPGLVDAIDTSRRESVPLTARFRVRHPARGLIWLHLSAKAPRRQGSLCFWSGALQDVTAEVAQEEALRLAHMRLNTLTDNSATALFEYRFSETGEIEVPYFSARLPEISGVPREDIEACGTAFERHVHPDDYEWIHETLDRSIRECRSITFKHRLNHPQKGLRWILASITPAAQPDGAVVVYSSMLDITEQVAAEARAAEAAEQVRQALDRLKTVSDLAPVALYEFRRRPDGRSDFPYTSARFSELTGFSREEIAELEDRIFDRILPDDLPRVMASIEESLRDMTPWSQRFRIAHPDRGTIWLEAATVAPQKREDGSVVWTASMHDVTASVQREAELQRFRTALDVLNAGAVMLECATADDLSAWPVVYANPAVASLAGCRRAGGEAKAAHALLKRLEAQPNMARLVATLRQGRLVEFEAELPEAAPSRHFTGVAVPLAENGDAPSHAVLLIDEVTDVLRAEEERQRGERLALLGQMAGGVSHDFNNLLAVILGSIELLEVARTPEETQQLVAAAREAVMRGQTLNESLLAFAGRSRLAPRTQELGAFVRAILPLIERTLPSRIALKVAVPKDLPPVLLDTAMAESCLLNLVINAREAIEGAGSIKIVLDLVQRVGPGRAMPEPWVVLAVEDTGSGIPQDLQDRVFEPFFTTRAGGQGSGLGLSRVRGFAEQMGGFVTLGSEPGRGTRVAMHFPMAAVDAISEPELTCTGARDDGPAGLRVLLVDDAPAVATVMARMLELEGCEVVTASGSLQARELAREAGPFDLLLSDVIMPHENGLDLSLALREIMPDLAVILMSGYTENEIKGKLPAQVVFLRKPVSRDDLAQALRQCRTALDSHKT